MPANTWAEVDALCLDVLSVCSDGRERTIDQIHVHPADLVRVAVEQLVTARHLAVSHGTFRTTYRITTAGYTHLRENRVSNQQKVAV